MVEIGARRGINFTHPGEVNEVLVVESAPPARQAVRAAERVPVAVTIVGAVADALPIEHGSVCVATRPGWSTLAAMADVAYVSRVRIERLGGPQRLAYLPAEQEPVTFGVHSEVAEHYGVAREQYPPHATTLDYVVAAAGG